MTPEIIFYEDCVSSCSLTFYDEVAICRYRPKQESGEISKSYKDYYLNKNFELINCRTNEPFSGENELHIRCSLISLMYSVPNILLVQRAKYTVHLTKSMDGAMLTCRERVTNKKLFVTQLIKTKDYYTLSEQPPDQLKPVFEKAIKAYHYLNKITRWHENKEGDAKTNE